MVTYHVDGRLVSASEATVDVRDRGFMYGDAAFETLRAYGGEVFEWDAHVTRLRRTCETLGFDEAVPTAADLRDRIDETLAANDFDDAYVRLSVTRGVQPGKLTPSEAVDPTVVVVVSELPRGGTAGEDVWDGPARLATVETRRTPASAVPADAKTHNYLNGILARLELRESGAPPADEALLLDEAGHPTEGATSNLFFVRDGVLRTPTLELPVLPGVTRRVVLDLAEREGVPVETGRYEVGDLRTAEEVFVTNTTWEVRPVERVDDVAFDEGAVTATLARAFDRFVEARCYR